jgi:hypothetical protein
MNKIQKFVNLIKSDVGFYFILIFVIILAFCILSPKISAQLFPVKRQAILNEFVNNTKINGINSQEYWKFREFYSPGYFIFSRNGIDEKLLKKTQTNIGINYNQNNINLTFLVFSSPLVSSLDMLTKQTDLNTIINLQKIPKENILYINKNNLIYKESSKIIKIIFLLNNNEMKKANGFFKYTENDQKLTEGENWFNITSVKIN